MFERFTDAKTYKMAQVELFILCLTINQALSRCAPSNVMFIHFQSKIRRSLPHLMEAVADKCPGLYELFFYWNVKDTKTLKVIQTGNTSFFSINGYEYDSNSVFTRLYRVTVFVSHYKDMRPYSGATEEFEFMADRMHIEISGGFEKMHPLNETLIVDAKSWSRDVSYPPNEDAFEGNKVYWTINPTLPDFEPPSDLRLEVPGFHLKLFEVYNFTVNVTRTKIASFINSEGAFQTVKIVPRDAPEINIECIKNCINPHPNETTAFCVVCVSNCKPHMNYTWTTSPEIPASKTDFGNGHDLFIAESGSFKAGDTVIVRVKTNKSASLYKLQFMKPIKKGSCKITPERGKSGETLFKLLCDGFESPNGNLAYIIYQKTNEGKGVMLNENVILNQSSFFLSEGNPAKVLVEVQDERYLREEVVLSVDVQFLNYSKNDIKNLVLDDLNSVTAYSLKQSRNKVVQMMSFLLDGINRVANMTDSEKKDLHKHMVESIMYLDVQCFDMSFQKISILNKFVSFKLDTDTLTSRLIGKSLVSASIFACGLNDYAGDYFVPVDYMKNLFENVLSICSKLLKKVPAIEAVLTQETLVHDYDSYDDLTSAKLSLRDDLRDMMDNLFISIQAVSSGILQNYIPDEKPLVFKSETMDFLIRKVWVKSLLRNRTISLSNTTKSKVFLTEKLIRELEKRFTFLDYKFAILKENPYWWHANISRLNTDIILFDLSDYCHQIVYLKNTFMIYLKTTNVPAGTFQGDLTNGNMVVYRFQMIPNSMLVVEFKVFNETYHVTSSTCYCKEEDFDNGIEISSNGKTLRVKSPTDSNVVYVCVKSSKAPMRYEGSFAIFSCVYWDLKIGMWNFEGCEVREGSMQKGGSMVCECRHASIFAGQIFVPDIQINQNLDFDFYISLRKNWLSVGIVMSLLLIWGLILLIAWRTDEKKSAENTICKLDDNIPGDCQAYFLVVFTGGFFDAGTTADVCFQLIGTKARSRRHLIKCSGVPVLNRGSQDWFLIFAPCYLGSVKKIRLWHNAKGNQPHWYCKRIIVQYLKTGTQYCFIVEKWFSLIWGSGKIYREIHVRSDEYLKQTKRIFRLRMETGVKDNHILFSILTRDSQSSYTSTERAGAAACMFFTFLLTSGILFKLPKSQPVDSIDLHFPYSLQEQEIMVIFESWLLSVLLGFLVIMLFRNSAPE